jgi:hypothetical protein
MASNGPREERLILGAELGTDVCNASDVTDFSNANALFRIYALARMAIYHRTAQSGIRRVTVASSLAVGEIAESNGRGGGRVFAGSLGPGRPAA